MPSRLMRAIIGVLMVGVGLVQAALFAVQADWIPTALGMIYSLLGVAYLWIEVYAAG